MINVLKKQRVYIVFVSVLMALTLVSSGKAHAAMLTVASNTDESTTNSLCSIREAMTNVNDHAQTYPDCVAGDGSSDTITLPEGEITIAADLPAITTSVAIHGAGIDKTTLNGGSTAGVFASTAQPTDTLTITAVKIRAFKLYGIYTTVGDLTIDHVEMDCTDAVFDSGADALGGAIGAANGGTNSVTVNINTVYVHDCSADANVVWGIGIISGINGDIDLTVTNTTVDDIHNASGTSTGLLVSTGITGGVSGDIASDITNTTIDNITSAGGSAIGVGLLSLAQNSGDLHASLLLTNSTVGAISGVESLFGGSAGVGVITGSIQSGHVGYAVATLKNNVIYGTKNSCIIKDITSQLGGTGTGNASLTSGGGNLSDDTKCSSYFTQQSDQNNITSLESLLGPLTYNGGSVPTRALLKGSPAIDSGATVAGLSTDARGATRPQGTAYDSGAYESPYSKSVSSLADTGQNIKLFLAAAVGLVLASGAVLITKMRKK